MARRQNETKLPAPWLLRVSIDDPDADLPDDYPFSLPWLTPEFELEFSEPVTILTGENGSGNQPFWKRWHPLQAFTLPAAVSGRGMRYPKKPTMPERWPHVCAPDGCPR